MRDSTGTYLNDMMVRYDRAVSKPEAGPTDEETAQQTFDVVTAKQELIVPPKIKLEQAKGFSLFMLKAIISGRGDEVIELARTNLRRWRKGWRLVQRSRRRGRVRVVARCCHGNHNQQTRALYRLPRVQTAEQDATGCDAPVRPGTSPRPAPPVQTKGRTR